MELLSHIKQLTQVKRLLYRKSMKYYVKVMVDLPCKKCGKMDVQHKTKGICATCYRMGYYWAKKQKQHWTLLDGEYIPPSE